MIDKVILKAIAEFNLPIVSKLITDMKIYMAEKMKLDEELEDLIKSEIISYDTEKIDKNKRYAKPREKSNKEEKEYKIENQNPVTMEYVKELLENLS